MTIIIISIIVIIIIILIIIIFIIQQSKIRTEKIERNGNRTQTYYCCVRSPPRKLKLSQMFYGVALTGLKNYCHLGMCSETPGHCLSGLRWKSVETGILSRVVLS